MDANVSICGPNLSAVMPQFGLKKAVLVAAGGIGAGRHGARGHGGAAVSSAVSGHTVMCHVSCVTSTAACICPQHPRGDKDVFLFKV